MFDIVLRPFQQAVKRMNITALAQSPCDILDSKMKAAGFNPTTDKFFTLPNNDKSWFEDVWHNDVPLPLRTEDNARAFIKRIQEVTPNLEKPEFLQAKEVLLGQFLDLLTQRNRLTAKGETGNSFEEALFGRVRIKYNRHMYPSHNISTETHIPFHKASDQYPETESYVSLPDGRFQTRTRCRDISLHTHDYKTLKFLLTDMVEIVQKEGELVAPEDIVFARFSLSPQGTFVNSASTVLPAPSPGIETSAPPAASV
ncbi:MAG: hypothetical protein H6863_03435 [Rhodospirillales bacterium]|nr:hypothetical protein [Rhodospirillales bacterium]